jgi:L-seryl-tRNA(Ser) seleniumtransferase
VNAPRALPAIGTTLERPAVRALLKQWPRALVTEGVRAVVAAARAGAPLPESDDAWRDAMVAWLESRAASTLRPALNATGVVLHTNLGRAPLAPAAIEAIASVASGAATLEYDVATGARGSRHVHCAALLAELSGAEDAIVVNNCAAGLVLTLQALAAGRESIVSRGELIEIGGSFRVPDIMATSGTTLVEVGTTNRTHVADYRRALNPRTGAIVKVHRSNFTVDGFVAEATVPELVPVAAEADVPLINDFGSGLMLDLSPWGLHGEPTVRDAVREGATLVLFSGDKLLGGPQAGIIVGRKHAVDALRRHPMARALRVDKLTLAALEATLALYREPSRAVREIPALAMLTASLADVTARAGSLAESLRARGTDARVEPTEGTVGGGAFPTARIPSSAVTIGGDIEAIEERLRRHALPVIATIRDGRLRLDLRSIPADQDAVLTRRVVEATSGSAS